ncbi:uncharacterized protein LOC113791970 isoform X2 [Dermatophagoides pteronyssinus]|uniref:uncharacterized protein LOC113791970 isoform X2 n=1 Tax=Dermatophagoides pteronyssinus TaxID=6956 RepID=UPI003F672CD3
MKFEIQSQVFAQNKLNNNDDNGNVSSFGQHNLSSPSPLQLLSTTSTTTTMFGSYVFDPHVQAQCERNLMNIMVTFDQPFNGIVHVRNFRRNPCQIYGNGSTIVTMTIDLLAPSNRPNFCGIHRVKGTEERSISLVVRLHKALELSDDKHFVITCGNTEFSNRNKNEKLMFKFVDRHGHKITKLYHGESYRLRAEIVQQQQISSQLKTSKSAYHLYVKNCLIFNGNDTDVEFLDNNGCPTVIGQMLSPFKQIGQNIAEAEIYSMFKLPGTNQLHMQCLVELVENCNFCDPSLCPLIGNETMMIDTTDSNHNITSIGNKRNRPTSEMQMLVSTTVYVFEPDQQMSSSIMLAGIGGKSDGSDDFIHGNCNEWRFPWLIALCIMLGILLIIMMVVNIFLCTSMSCSCFRSEMVEHEPTIMDDYDPYKIDIGSYYSPYDSRLSLNRSTTSIANPMTSTVVGNPHHHYHLQHNTHHHHGNNGDRSGSHYTAQQQPLHLNTVHHHHPHHNRPIPSMSSSYSPSTTENTTHSRPGAKLINNNKNIGNGNKSRNSKPNKSRQQKPSNPKSSSIIPLNGNTYNPYQHSPQSIRSDDYY